MQSLNNLKGQANKQLSNSRSVEKNVHDFHIYVLTLKGDVDFTLSSLTSVKT